MLIFVISLKPIGYGIKKITFYKKSIKLNAVEIAKVNGGNTNDIDINPDGSCYTGPCKGSNSEGNREGYTKTMSSKDRAWGA